MIQIGSTTHDQFDRAVSERLNECAKEVRKGEALRAAGEAQVAAADAHIEWWKAEERRILEAHARLYEAGEISDRVMPTGIKERRAELAKAEKSRKKGYWWRQEKADEAKQWDLALRLAASPDGWEATRATRRGRKIVVTVEVDSAVGNRMEDLKADIMDRFQAALDLLVDLWVASNRRGSNSRPSPIFQMEYLDQLRGVHRDVTPEVTDCREYPAGWMPSGRLCCANAEVIHLVNPAW